MGSANFDFEGETVLVPGAGSGIGHEVATRFEETGPAVVVADVRETPRDESETTPTHELIEGAGGEAAYVETDVTDPEALAAGVDRAEAFGGLDVMVNNAEVHVSGTIREVSPERSTGSTLSTSAGRSSGRRRQPTRWSNAVRAVSSSTWPRLIPRSPSPGRSPTSRRWARYG